MTLGAQSASLRAGHIRVFPGLVPEVASREARAGRPRVDGALIRDRGEAGIGVRVGATRGSPRARAHAALLAWLKAAGQPAARTVLWCCLRTEAVTKLSPAPTPARAHMRVSHAAGSRTCCSPDSRLGAQPQNPPLSRSGRAGSRGASQLERTSATGDSAGATRSWVTAIERMSRASRARG